MSVFGNNRPTLWGLAAELRLLRDLGLVTDEDIHTMVKQALSEPLIDEGKNA